ncbi:12448_t:CDS:2 [Ambispora leptoticha]|uniref:12448_t:CDS:1 n=1 Tax=Ambispora leptoticha TaxID=144679 RepID=A0A9N9FYD7_9GLOM|nr:12448_t:CDS:2 [Ambispora leptoticha]
MLSTLPGPSTLGKPEEWINDFYEEEPEMEDKQFTYMYCCEMAKYYNSKEDFRRLQINVIRITSTPCATNSVPWQLQYLWNSQTTSQYNHPVHPSFPEAIIDDKSFSIQIDFQVGAYLLWDVTLSDEQGSHVKAYVKAVQKHQYLLDTHQLLTKVGYAPKSSFLEIAFGLYGIPGQLFNINSHHF